ncbi:MAG: beta-lactamase family protein [Comamonadaceae bacterium]|nr:beta-lactamase family protein [Comamonadaceae bacterium]
MALPEAAAPPAIRYRWRNIGYTLDDYLERRRVTGLLILKNGQIVAERYRYGRQDDARFLSFSMAKSVTSLLVGIALDKGLIASLDDPASRYVKDLEGSAYGATTVRQLLRMSSGIHFTERYDGRTTWRSLSRARPQGHPTPGACCAASPSASAGRRKVRLRHRRNRRAGPRADRRHPQDYGRAHQRMALAADGRRARRLLAPRRRPPGAGRWRLQRHAALPAGCHRPGAPARRLCAGQGHAVLWLWLPVLAVPAEGAQLCPAGCAWPNGVRAAGHRHRDGADGGL